MNEIEPVVNDLVKMTEMCFEKDKEIERLENIIKEVRELLKNDYFEDGSFTNYYKVFELLDKENKE